MLRANRDASYEAIPDPDDASAAARRHASLQAKIAQFNELQQRRRQLMLHQVDGADEKDDVDGPEGGRDESWIEVIEARDRVLASSGDILPPGVITPPSRKMRRGDRRRSTLSTISSDADDDSAMHRYSEYEPGPGVYTEPPSRQNEHIMMHPNLRSSFECLYDTGMEMGPTGVSSLERRARSGSLLSGLRSLESLTGDWEAEELEARRWREDDEGSTSTASAASFVRLPADLRLPQTGEAPAEEEAGSRTPQALDEPIAATVIKPQEASVPPTRPEDRPNSHGDRSNLPGDRPNHSDNRPIFSGDRPNLHDNRPIFPGDRKNFPGDRKNFPDDRPIFPGEAPKRPKPRGKPDAESDRKRFARSMPQPPKRRSVQLDDEDSEQPVPVTEDVQRPDFYMPNMLDSRRSRDSLGDDLEALRRSMDEDEYSEDNRPKSPVTASLKEPLGTDSNSPISASSSAFPFQQETNSAVPLTRGIRMSDRQAISKRPSLSEMRQRFESLSQSSDTTENPPGQPKTDPLRRPPPRRPSEEHRSSLSSNDFGPKVELAPGKNVSRYREPRDSISSVDLSETPNSTLPKRHSQRMDSSLSSDDPNSLDASSLGPQSRGSGSRASEPRESPGLRRYEDKIRNQPAVAFVQLAGESDPKLTRFHAWSTSHPTQEYIVNATSNETNINMSVPLGESDATPESERHWSSFQMMTKDERQSRKAYGGDEDDEERILPSNAASDQYIPPERENDVQGDANSSNKSRIPRFNTRKGDPIQEDIVQQNLSQQQHLSHDETPEPPGSKETPSGQPNSRIPRRKHGVPPPLLEKQLPLGKEPGRPSDNEFPSSQQLSRIPRRQARHEDSASTRPRAMDDANSSSDEYYGTPKSHNRFPPNGPLASRSDDPKKRGEKENRREPQRGLCQSLEPRIGESSVSPLKSRLPDQFDRNDSDIEPEYGQGRGMYVGSSNEPAEREDSRFQPSHYNKGEGYVMSLANELKDPSLFESQENRLPFPVARKSTKEQRDLFFGVNGDVPNAVDEDILSPNVNQRLQSSYPQHVPGKEIYETSLDDIENDEIPTAGHPGFPMANPPPYSDAVRSSKVKNQHSLDSDGPNDQSSDYDTLQATWSRPTGPTVPTQKGTGQGPSNSVEEFIDHVYRSKGSPDRSQKVSRPYANEDSQFSDGFSSDAMPQDRPERPPYLARRVDPRGRSNRDQRKRMLPSMMADAGDRSYDNVPVSQSDPHAPRREPGPPPRPGKYQNRDVSSSPPPPLPQRMWKPTNDASKIAGKDPLKPNSGRNEDPAYLRNHDPLSNVPPQARQPDQFHYDPRYPDNVSFHPSPNQDPSKQYPGTSAARQPRFPYGRDPINSSGEYPRTEDSDDNRPGQRNPRNEQFNPQFPQQYDFQPTGRYDISKSAPGMNERPEQSNYPGPNRLPNQQPAGKPQPSSRTRGTSRGSDQSGGAFDIGSPSGRDMMPRFPLDGEILPSHLAPQQSQPRQGRAIPIEHTPRNRHPSSGSSRPGQFALPNDLIYPSDHRPENAVRRSHDGTPARPDSDNPERRPSNQSEFAGGYPDPRSQPHRNFRPPDSANNRNLGHFTPQFPHQSYQDPHSAMKAPNPNPFSRSFDPKNSGELHHRKPENPNDFRPFDPSRQRTGEQQHDGWNQPDTQHPQGRFAIQQPIRKRNEAGPNKKVSDASSRSEPTSVQQGFEFDPVTCQFIPRTQAVRPDEQSSHGPRQQSNPGDGGLARRGQNLVFDPITGQFVPNESQRPQHSNQQHPDAFNFNSPHSSGQRDPNNAVPLHRTNANSQSSAPHRNFDEQQPNQHRPRHPSGYDSAASQPKDRFDPQRTGRHNQQYDRQHPGPLNMEPSSRYPNHSADPRYRANSSDRENNPNHNSSQPDVFWKQLPVSSNPASFVQSGPSSLRHPDRPQNVQPELQMPQESNQPWDPQDFQLHPHHSQPSQSSSYPTSGQPVPRRGSGRQNNRPGGYNQPNEMPSAHSVQERPTREGRDRAYRPDNQPHDRYSQRYGQRPQSYPASNQSDPRNESRRPEVPPDGSDWYKDGTQHPKMRASSPNSYPQDNQNPLFSRNYAQQPHPNSSHNSNQFGSHSDPRRPEERNATRLSNRSSSPSNSDKRSGFKPQRNSSPSSRPPLPPGDDPTQFIDHKYLSLNRLPPHNQRVPEGPQYLSDIIVPSDARAEQNEAPTHPGASYQLRSNPGALTQLVHSSRRDREGTTAQRAIKPEDPDNIRRVQRAASEAKAPPPPLPPKAGPKITRSSSSVTPSRSEIAKSEEAAKLERLRATFEEAEKRLGDLGNRDDDADERREYFWRQMASLQKADFSWDDTDEWVTDAAKESPWALLKDPGDRNDPVAELERMYLDLDLDREDLMERAERRVVPDSLYDRFVQLRTELPPSEETHEAPPALNHRLPSDSDDPTATPSNCSTLRSNATSSRSVPHIPHRSPYPHKVRDDKAYRRLHPNVTAPFVSRRQQSVVGSSRATPFGGTTPSLSRRESDAGLNSSSRSTLSRSHSLGRQSDVLAKPSPTSTDYLLPRSSETLDQRKQWPPRYAEEPDPKLDDMAYRRLVRSSNTSKSTHKSLLGKERPAPFTDDKCSSGDSGDKQSWWPYARVHELKKRQKEKESQEDRLHQDVEDEII